MSCARIRINVRIVFKLSLLICKSVIFSFDEFAKYDLPASLEFAMACSKQKRISYIGHSQGTTIGFAAFSQNQTLAAKVDLFIALAPVATVGNMKSPIKYLSYFSGGIEVSCVSDCCM